MPRALLTRLAVLGSGLVLLTACDTGHQSLPTEPSPPIGDEVVAGVNLSRLFAPVTLSEEEAVRAVWAARDAARPSRYRYTVEAEGVGSDGATYTVLAGRDAATDVVIHYGLARVPSDPVGTYPTVLVCPEGLDEAVTEADALTEPGFGFLRDQSIQVIVSYRGETLRALGQTFVSPAAPDLYDRDVDDALALLDAALVLIPRTDTGRLGAYGFGRGGAVALLAAIRDDRFRAVADLAGPSGFLSDPFRDEARLVLGHGADVSDFPGIAALADTVLFPLRDSLITYEEARLALLRRSARPFVESLPAIHIGHGTSDDEVAPLFSVLLDLALRAIPFGPPRGHVTYPAAHDDLPTQSNVQSDVASLMDAYIRTP